MDELLKACDAATAGPWKWTVNKSTKHVRLDSRTKGWMTVMDFVRWGMGGAAPRFCVAGLMERCDDLSAAIPGEEHHASWDQRINHPDAEFIALARTALPAALRTLAAIRDKTRIMSDPTSRDVGKLIDDFERETTKATP